MNSAQKKYLVALYAFLGFGPTRLKLLIDYFSEAKKIWNAKSHELRKTGLSEKLVSGFISFRESFSFDNYFKELKRKKVKYLTYQDVSYPKNLVDIEGAPLVLYLTGKLLKKDENAVAIVGARRMTAYGRRVTSAFSTQLAIKGVTIVSGLAFGIDAVSHNACLEAKGRTIAVLASGVDVISPLSNTWLANKILAQGGAIVSEYPLGTLPTKTSFPSRNRIISGLSKAVVVVEGLKKSGTIHTAKHAADQGKTVFAVPGQVTSEMSSAPHYLISCGAKIAFSVKDILEDLDQQKRVFG